MDSPLLPQFDKRSNFDLGDVSLIDDPSMLADLSMDDSEIHGTPSGSGSHLYTREPQRQSQTIFGIHSSTSSTNPTGRRVQIDHQLDDEETTPIKSKPVPSKQKPRFSLFAAPKPSSAEQDEEEEEEGDDGGNEDDTIQIKSSQRHQEEIVEEENNEERQRQKPSLVEKEDKLRSSLYELKKMNEVFDGVLGALEGVRGHNQRLAERVKQTSSLLDEYTAIMGQAEHTQKLLSNPKWTGSADDAEAIQAHEIARILEIERVQEESRRQAEAARLAEEERERRLLEREKAESSHGRGRGGTVRGGGRGIPSGVTRGVVRGRGTGIPRPSMAPTTRPTSSNSTRRGTTTTTGTTRGGGGLGGQYNHVKSSGYGPRG